ncbi:ABC transporter [Brochothrix campestris FSL F6-1037]|uniref:ABC transporter n=1 Tax=Brochothrix campestris FSL F6-1037 TaxID=1265861 RepID=W7D5L3_9LIST|nr:ATP-binding cassette domain-containing protein [Brochothrix campestris]EUJ40568.1 ABC transporter [Brochothrix campestris FSL F6-1037]
MVKARFYPLYQDWIFYKQVKFGIKQKKVTNFDCYRRQIGYVFQAFNLVPYLSAVENVRLALDIHAKVKTIAQIKEILKSVGIVGQTLEKKCADLSGGQQQRVAIARAVALDEKLIIADEPTGNLDKNNAKHVLEIFEHLKLEGKCIIMVTHDRQLANQTDIVLTLKAGELVVLKD